MRTRLMVTGAFVSLVALGAVVFFAVAPGASAGVWKAGYRPIPYPHLIAGYGGKCVDIPSGLSNDGAQLQMWPCNDSAAQVWTSGAHGEAMALGKCMDVAWGSRDNGAKVQLAWCNGGGAQEWVLTAAGDLVNPQSGKCLDVRDWNGARGAALQIWECTGGDNQKWVVMAPGERVGVRLRG